MRSSVQVLFHIYFVFLKCNRVKSRMALGYAGLLAVGSNTFFPIVIFFKPPLSNQALAYCLATPLVFSAHSRSGRVVKQPLPYFFAWVSSRATFYLSTQYECCLGLGNFLWLQTNECCLGLGIDDMFALVITCENLTEEEMLLPLEEKMGLVLILASYCPNSSYCLW